MKCAFRALLDALPVWLRCDVEKAGYDAIEQIRMRLGAPVELCCRTGSRWLTANAQAEDIRFVINAATKYSPWAAQSIAQGYVTANGGHRIGICGEAVMENGAVKTVTEVTSLCIRVAKDLKNIAQGLDMEGNILILGPPGSGKTTLLRDIARKIAEDRQVCVVDERYELFPVGFARGRKMDVLTGCAKAAGMEMVLRTLGPEVIAVDEITSEADCDALTSAMRCGVRLLATAHATDSQDLRRRKIYRPIAASGVFGKVIVVRPDKSWYTERMNL